MVPVAVPGSGVKKRVPVLVPVPVRNKKNKVPLPVQVPVRKKLGFQCRFRYEKKKGSFPVPVQVQRLPEPRNMACTYTYSTYNAIQLYNITLPYIISD